MSEHVHRMLEVFLRYLRAGMVGRAKNTSKFLARLLFVSRGFAPNARTVWRTEDLLRASSSARRDDES